MTGKQDKNKAVEPILRKPARSPNYIHGTQYSSPICPALYYTASSSHPILDNIHRFFSTQLHYCLEAPPLLLSLFLPFLLLLLTLHLRHIIHTPLNLQRKIKLPHHFQPTGVTIYEDRVTTGSRLVVYGDLAIGETFC